MTIAPIWTDELGRSMLASLSDDVIHKQWSSRTRQGNEACDWLRRDLIDRARRDGQVRGWITRNWRKTHADAVSAADHAVTAGMTGEAFRELEALPARDVLLAFLLDEFDDGRELAQTFLRRLDDELRRRELRATLEGLLGSSGSHCRRTRIAIVGGHQRDESRLGERLFDNSPFEVRWETFAKKPSSGIVKKGVVGLLRHADAALIISGMASHMLTQYAKDYAQRTGIRWRCIEKATDNQLKTALGELFPELASGWC